MTRDAAAELVYAHRNVVKKACARWGIYGQDWEDILVWCVERAMRKASLIKPGNNQGWVWRLANRRCFDFLMRDKQYIPHPVASDTIVAITEVGKWRDYSHRSAEEDALERIEAQDAVRAARSLPGRNRNALLMEVAGMEYKQIAEREGVPIGTVKSRIFNARAALRSAEERSA